MESAAVYLRFVHRILHHPTFYLILLGYLVIMILSLKLLKPPRRTKMSTHSNYSRNLRKQSRKWSVYATDVPPHIIFTSPCTSGTNLGDDIRGCLRYDLISSSDQLITYGRGQILSRLARSNEECALNADRSPSRNHLKVIPSGMVHFAAFSSHANLPIKMRASVLHLR